MTTSVRHHPFEYLFASTIYWLALVLLDGPAFVVLVHILAVFGMTFFQHGNVRLPERLERWLQPVLVTTDMHRIHHSVVFEQANSNYRAVLSVWDRLFGTYTRITRAQQDRIVFGVRELPPRDCLKPSAMLLTRGGSLGPLGLRRGKWPRTPSRRCRSACRPCGSTPRSGRRCLRSAK